MRYAALGDSFSAGWHAYPDVPPWPDLLAESLGLDASTYLNTAVEGVTSEAVMEQVEPALAFRPDLVTLACGANDVLLRPRPDIDAFAHNLAWMLDRICLGAPAARLLLVTQGDVSRTAGFRPRSGARVSRGFAAVNDEVRAAARRIGAECVDIAAMPWEAAHFSSDGIHPSIEGNRRIATAVERALAARPPEPGAREPRIPA